ncbi:DoxX family membrane protein [Paraburkholderia sp. CNPSo 3157]|uniref:DoxX family membrane protein n=1 Tax=Paraburkholderia franconis TaxID=2654983 RepID=A0A7X1NK45_9BURK|nr:DoxX family protein [Paraburkholderia franconis]MPW23136.1 DoxX family membrane protein [Paraburkholderia franconis]
MNRFSATDLALLFLRVTASALVLFVHGLPKVLHYASQLDAIEDPLHLGKTLTLGFAIFAEVVCPLLMIAGIATRLAALPIMLVSAIALGLVHREWTLGQGQFAWMLLIMFGTIALGGAGRYRIALPPHASRQRQT